MPHVDDAEPTYLLAAPIGDLAPVLVPADLRRHRHRITMKMFYPVSLYFGIDLRHLRFQRAAKRDPRPVRPGEHRTEGRPDSRRSDVGCAD
ncbi:hypothetical protein [Actinoallomurus iriomotensis]|uniref:hypothetical protein n=1 Tax=Actinoallomurus iriomotensis TaxID=478107 RepID=UPI0025577FC4|nr:hypothetical protein [Actinoallomurus iriomotensis]